MRQLPTGPKMTPLWQARILPPGAYFGDAKIGSFLDKMFQEDVPREVLRKPLDLRQGSRRRECRYGERIHIDLAIWARQFSPINVWGQEVFPGGESND